MISCFFNWIPENLTNKNWLKKGWKLSVISGLGQNRLKKRRTLWGGRDLLWYPQYVVTHKNLQISKNLKMLITFNWEVLDNFWNHIWSLCISNFLKPVIVFFRIGKFRDFPNVWHAFFACQQFFYFYCGKSLIFFLKLKIIITFDNKKLLTSYDDNI